MTNLTEPTPLNKIRLFRTFDSHNLHHPNVTYNLHSTTYSDDEFLLEIRIDSLNHTHYQFITRAEVAKVIWGEDD